MIFFYDTCKTISLLPMAQGRMLIREHAQTLPTAGVPRKPREGPSTNQMSRLEAGGAGVQCPVGKPNCWVHIQAQPLYTVREFSYHLYRGSWWQYPPHGGLNVMAPLVNVDQVLRMVPIMSNDVPTCTYSQTWVHTIPSVGKTSICRVRRNQGSDLTSPALQIWVQALFLQNFSSNFKWGVGTGKVSRSEFCVCDFLQYPHI